MDVKRFPLKVILCQSVFLVTLFKFIESAVKCDRPLMNKYMLTGSEYSVTSPMKLCAHVHERCCTISDEIKLTKLWNHRSLPLLQRHKERVFDNMMQISNFFFNMTAIDPKLILVNLLVTKKVPYRKQVCQVVSRNATATDKKNAKRYYKFSKQEKIDPYPRIEPFRSTYKSRNPCDVLFKPEEFFPTMPISNQYSNQNPNQYQNRYLSDLPDSSEGKLEQQANLKGDRTHGKQKRASINLKSSPYHKFLRGTKYDNRRQLHVQKDEGRQQTDSPKIASISSEENHSSEIIQKDLGARSLRDPTRQEMYYVCREYHLKKANRQMENSFKPILSFRNYEAEAQEAQKEAEQLASFSHKMKEGKEAKKVREEELAQQKLKNQQSSQGQYSNSQQSSQGQYSSGQQSSQSQYSRSQQSSQGQYSRSQQSSQGQYSRSQQSNEGQIRNSKQPTDNLNTQGAISKEGELNDGYARVNQTPDNRSRNSDPNQSYPQNNQRQITSSSSRQSRNSQPKSLARQLNSAIAQPLIPNEYLRPRPENLFPQAEKYESIKLKKMECYFHETSFTKEFIIVNVPKVKFCYGIYRKFLDFDIKLFINSMAPIKGQMTQVLESKKMFYCALCDAHSHRFFDHKNKVVVYNFEYCRRILVEHADYIRFFNIIFMEFASQLLQYVQCFESDANVFSFPFQNMLTKHLRRVPIWKNCLKNAQTKGFTTACWSICNKISIQRISPVWDGDVKALERVTIAILSFIRKFDLFTSQHRAQFGNSTSVNFTVESVYNLRATNNVDGLLTEPLNPSMLITNKRFIGNIQLRQWLLGKKSWNSTVDDIDRKKLVVDKFMQYLDLADIDSIKNMMMNQERLKIPKLRVYNDSQYINSDRYNSTVNNLINQLYNTTVYGEIFHNDLPRRYLRQAVQDKIKEFGIDPKQLGQARKLSQNPNNPDSDLNMSDEERMAQGLVNKLQPRKSSPTSKTRSKTKIKKVVSKKKSLIRVPKLGDIDFKFPDNYTLYKESPVSPITPSNYSMIQSFGSLVTHNYTAPQIIEDEDLVMGIEASNEFFEKNLAGIDITFYGTILDQDGMDPLKDYPLAMFSYNVSKLIGLQFKPPEKISNEVLHLYMKAGPKFINKFNSDMSETVMPYKEIIESFPDFKKLRRFEMIQRMFDMRKSPALNKEIEKAKHVAHSKLAEQGHRKKMEEIREKEYAELKKAREHAKIDAREKLKKHDHVDHGFFEGLFSGIKNFFVGLFGS